MLYNASFVVLFVCSFPQPEELFDDLEAEFTLEKPKVVKKNSDVPFGGLGGGAAGLKVTPGLGGGKKAVDEVKRDICVKCEIRVKTTHVCIVFVSVLYQFDAPGLVAFFSRLDFILFGLLFVYFL